MMQSNSIKIVGVLIVPLVAFFAFAAPHAHALVACTMEAKQCPDGSYVGRSGPNCDFAACPVAPIPVPIPTPAPTPVPTPVCPVFTRDVYYGTTDASTGGQVTSLQAFLAAQGYLSSASVIGIFGPLTLHAVQSFQRDNGVITTGYVGVLTRAHIQAKCPPNPQPTSAVTINSVAPNSGSVGTSVTLGGSGFTSDNIIHFGGGAIAHVAAAPAIFNCPMMPVGSTGTCGGFSQTLTFTVPSSVGPYCAPGMACPMYILLVTPGAYNVSVENSNGTSSAISFTVTGSGGLTQPLSITGLDAPASLALGVSGTWTVHASVPNSTGQLHYSVLWGDEVSGTAQILAPQSSQIQTSATFTHAYQHSGTFTPAFSVSDDSGHSATASTTVLVTPLYVY